MQVETYEVESKGDDEIQILASDGEAAMLIESLGLDGQKAMLNKDSGDFFPYRKITKEEHAVFKTLFTNRCEAKSYKDGPIPLRVLQLMSHAKELHHPDLAYFEVWYPEAGHDDPVLVGRKTYYQDPVYLLARWGNALDPFEALQEKAVKKSVAQAKVKLMQIQSKVGSALADVDSHVRAAILKGELFDPQLHGEGLC